MAVTGFRKLRLSSMVVSRIQEKVIAGAFCLHAAKHLDNSGKYRQHTFKER